MSKITSEDIASAIAEGKQARALKARALADAFKKLNEIDVGHVEQLGNLGPEWPQFLEALRHGPFFQILRHPWFEEACRIGKACCGGILTIQMLLVISHIIGWLK